MSRLIYQSLLLTNMPNASYSWKLPKKEEGASPQETIIVSSAANDYFFYRRIIDIENETRRSWDSLWKNIVMDNGKINPMRLKRELFDYSFLIQEATKVYNYISGGKLVKPTHTADEVISAFHEHLQELVNKKVDEEIKKR